MKTKLKHHRLKHNMTQAELAKIVKVRRETISLLEGGKYNPSLKLATKISKQFKTTTDKLFIFDPLELK